MVPVDTAAGDDALTRVLMKETKNGGQKTAKNGTNKAKTGKKKKKERNDESKAWAYQNMNSKAPKAQKATKAKGELQANLAEAMTVQDQLREVFNYDPTAAELCRSASDDHQRCLYEVLTPGSDFMCECRPTNGALVFGEVDANDDDYITLEEILTYFDSQTCEFPFKYTIDGVTNTYNNCTTDDDTFGLSWCSIRTLADGTHANGFWKYCEESSNVAAWEDAVARLDSDGDGKLAFGEAITNARRRRRKLLASPGAYEERKCNDCVVSEDCQNPVVKAIDGECRNYIKTKPLKDENLVRVLGTAMADVYCDKEEGDNYQPNIGGDWNYLSCERKRGGMDKWIERDDSTMVMVSSANSCFFCNMFFLIFIHLLFTIFLFLQYPKEKAVSIEEFIYCVAMVGSDIFNAPAMMLEIYERFNWLFSGLPLDGIVKECQTKIRDATDGKDALQYATYTIKQGPYANKRILSFMGTDTSNVEQSNVEQLYAALWSTPMASNMMRTMATEAADVANRLQPDFVTGHSLGGTIAEMVCSMTGFKGASFGAIGAFDPFSRVDEAFADGSAVETSKLSIFGYDLDDIAKYVSDHIGNYMISYKGLIQETLHDGVEFEVVMNVHDIPARTIASMDGATCSHIARSCDLRWTWFGGEPNDKHNYGHSSTQYALNSISKWTRGYDNDNVNEDFDKIFLPDVTKNVACDFCDRNEYCESNSCNLDLEQCNADGGKLPTLCPSNSGNSDAHSACLEDDDCLSGRCDWPVWESSEERKCYDKLSANFWCNQHNDCSSNYCNTFFACANKQDSGKSCIVNGDCHSNSCSWFSGWKRRCN